MEPTYLGDGVYAQLADANTVMLTTGSHDPAMAMNEIFLESDIIDKLQQFVEEARRRNELRS